MNSRSLVICDRDRDYCAALAEYIRLSDCGYEVIIYTDPAVFAAECIGKEISLLLMQEEFLFDAGGAALESVYGADTVNYTGMACTGLSDIGIAVLRQFVLTESRETAGEDHIYKYQSAACIVSAIGEDLKAAHRIVNEMEKGGGMQLIGVHSPLGHTLKTTFSLALGQILSEDREVLYINMEGYSGLTEILDIRSEYGLTDLIYDHTIHPGELIGTLARYTVKVNGLNVLLPARSPYEMQEIEPSMWLSLIGALAETGKYEAVILDMSDTVQGAFDLMNVCTDIYMPVRKDAVAMAKLKDFEHVLAKYPGADNIKGRLKKLKFPYFDDVDANMGGLKNSRLGLYIRQEILQDQKVLY